MGQEASSSQQVASGGYRVIHVARNSVAHDNRLVPYFDVILSINNEQVKEDAFEGLLNTKGVRMNKCEVLNTKNGSIRHVLFPLHVSLGCTIRFEYNIQRSKASYVHITSVQPHSTMSDLGLKANYDFVLGNKDSVFESIEDMENKHFNNSLGLVKQDWYVYSTLLDTVRVVHDVPGKFMRGVYMLFSHY